MRYLWSGLLSAVCLFSQAVEHPLPQPSVYGYSFAGPALKLHCIGALKKDIGHFPKYFAAQPPSGRRVCLDQLFQSLTPEPDFNSEIFYRVLAQNPNGNLVSADPALSLRMAQRIGVNMEAAKALSALASAGLLDDPVVLGPLIRCLDHPLLPVSQVCQETLFTLTRHDFIRPPQFGRRPPVTFEGRRQLIADWHLWQRQMQSGHPLFDGGLQSLVSSSLDDLLKRLSVLTKNPYLAQRATEGARLNLEAAVLFSFSIARDRVAGGWPRQSTLAAVGIAAFRPGLPGQAPPIVERWPLCEKPEERYREHFASLDLDVEVTVVTSDLAERVEAFRAAKESLAGLRRANRDGRL